MPLAEERPGPLSSEGWLVEKRILRMVVTKVCVDIHGVVPIGWSLMDWFGRREIGPLFQW